MVKEVKFQIPYAQRTKIPGVYTLDQNFFPVSEGQINILVASSYMLPTRNDILNGVLTLADFVVNNKGNSEDINELLLDQAVDNLELETLENLASREEIVLRDLRETLEKIYEIQKQPGKIYFNFEYGTLYEDTFAKFEGYNITTFEDFLSQLMESEEGDNYTHGWETYFLSLDGGIIPKERLVGYLDDLALLNKYFELEFDESQGSDAIEEVRKLAKSMTLLAGTDLPDISEAYLNGQVHCVINYLSYVEDKLNDMVRNKQGSLQERMEEKGLKLITLDKN